MTKLIFIVVVTGIVSLSACTQKLKESQVPTVVRAAFEKEYGGLKGSWDKEDGNYEVEFKKDGQAMSALIDENGAIVETETDIPETDLPKSIQDYMRQHYAGMMIKEAAKIIKANGEINYEAEVDDKDVIFDVNGIFIKEAKD